MTLGNISHGKINDIKKSKMLSLTLSRFNFVGEGGVIQPQPNGGNPMNSNVMGPSVDMGFAYDEAIDLEPIDFEHFVDEPDLGRQRSERMFRVSFGDSPPPPRGR